MTESDAARERREFRAAARRAGFALPDEPGEGDGTSARAAHPAVEFLRVLFDGLDGVIELRPLPTIERCFARPGEVPTLLDFIARYPTNLYAGVATRKAGSTTGTLADCHQLSAVYIDIDFKTTPAPEARRLLAEFPIPPSIVVGSGHGLHVYWLFREPFTLPADEPRARHLLARLAARLKGDKSAAECARILRVPGTINHKPAEGPDVPVVLELCEPGRRYNPSELEEWLPPLPSPPARQGFQAPDEPIKEGERHGKLYALARALKVKNLSPVVVLAALREFNAEQCTPPLPDAEVERQVESAFAQRDRPGFEPRPIEPIPGPDPDAPSAPERRRLTFMPLAELLAAPPERTAWLVEGRLVSAGVSLIAGKPKAGKSTLARCLGLAVARGAAFLGWATTRGSVLYLAFEEKASEVRAHFAAMGATAEDVRVCIAQAPEDALVQLRAIAETEHPGLIIIDTLFRFVRVRDGNDYAEMSRALEAVILLARETGAHVLVVHHLGKGERSGGDAILGSTAIFATVDTALLLRRAEHYRTLSTIQRYGSDLEEITLALDPHTRWVTAGGSRKDADEGAAADLLLEFLRGRKEALEESTILEEVEGRRAVKVPALRRLVQQGQVSRTGRGGKGDPYRYQAIPGGSEAEREGNPPAADPDQSPPPAPSQDSCSLVPTYTREQEKQESETTRIASPVAPDSCSQVSTHLDAGGTPFSGSREQAFPAPPEGAVDSGADPSAESPPPRWDDV